MNSLFRKEIVEKKDSHLGQVSLYVPLSFWLITYVIGLIIVGLIIFAIFGDFARKERVSGVLSSNKGLVEIRMQKTGLVNEIYVELGDKVEMGQPLLRIVNHNLLEDGAPYAKKLLFNLTLELDVLKKELLSLSDKYSIENEQLLNLINDLEAKERKYRIKISTQNEILDNARDIYSRMHSLSEKKIITYIELSKQKDKVLHAKQELQSLEVRLDDITSSIREKNTKIDLLPLLNTSEKNNLKSRISDIEKGVLEAKNIDISVIRSPVNGSVSMVSVKSGQMLSGSIKIISLLPEKGELQADLFIPSRAIGFAEVGQSVRLLYDAFPYQKFGFYNGEIIKISKSVIKPSDISLSPEMITSAFHVVVKLDKQYINASDKEIPLRSGMTLSADIVLENRKIWEWLLRPFLGKAS